MPKMRFWMTGIINGPYPETLQWWKAAEDVGFDTLGISDSPVIFKELYVTSAYCALNTSRIRVISAVTNPVTRHPSVTASGLFALDQLAPGRIGLGIATGDSALWGIGKKGIATVAHMRQYILAVKGLLRGEEVEYEDRRFSPQWRDWSGPQNIPVYVACVGPKVLKMASQVADGLIVCMGYGPENIKYVRGIINDACAEVGRNPDDLDIWWQASLVFADSVEEGMKVNLGVNINWLTMGSMEGKLIPEEYRDRLVQLAEDEHSFDATYHNVDRFTWTVERAKELGIYDFLLSRSPRFWGTPDDICRRLAQFREMGLTQWQLYVGMAGLDRLDIINKMGRHVIANLT